MLSLSSLATKKTATLFVKKILSRKIKRKNAVVIGLIGELGSGKTTFIQGFAHALRIKHRLVSPTFIIMRNYSLPTTHYQLVHVDAYRLKNSKELQILNFKSVLQNPKNIVLIEWADKIKKILPKETIWINFEHGKKESERIIKIPKF